VILDRSRRRWAPESAQPGADPAFETAVSATVSAVMRLVREGYAVEVVDGDGNALSDPIGSGETADVEALAARFATLVTRADDSNAGLGRVAATLPAGVTGPVVVITGRLTDDDADALAPLGAQSALPVLLAVDSPRGSVERTRAYGWHAAALGQEGEIAAAWANAVERGPARVG
jgi:hypothetical protein